MFLWLSSPDLAVKRVANRVEQGGHHIPEDVIRRRYFAGLKNLIKYYLPLADNILLLDNSAVGLSKTIAKTSASDFFKIEDETSWEEILRTAHGEKN